VTIPYPGLPLFRLAAGSSESRLCMRTTQAPAALTGLSRTYERRSAGCGARRVFSLQRHLASDGTQENIRGWLFRVATIRLGIADELSTGFSEPLDGEMDFLAGDATPEQRVLEKEKFRRLATAMRLLTESERECLLLRAGACVT